VGDIPQEKELTVSKALKSVETKTKRDTSFQKEIEILRVQLINE